MDDVEREKLRLTLIGMVSSAMNKYPSASKGRLKDLMNSAVDERYAARKAKEVEEAKKSCRQAPRRRSQEAGRGRAGSLSGPPSGGHIGRL